jgi:hypothetical protein
LNELLSFLSIHGLSFGLDSGDAIGGRWCFSHLDVLVVIIVVVVPAVIFLIEVDQVNVSLLFLWAVAGKVSYSSAIEAGIIVPAPIIYCCFRHPRLELSLSPSPSSSVQCPGSVYIHWDWVVVHPFWGVGCIELWRLVTSLRLVSSVSEPSSIGVIVLEGGEGLGGIPFSSHLLSDLF